MSFKKKVSFTGSKLALFAAAAIFVAAQTSTNVNAAENGSAGKIDLAALDMPERPLTVVLLSPLMEQGTQLGLAVIYDDPSTQRPSDYLEVYNRDGSLVAVAWFDRFGIERVAVDRASMEKTSLKESLSRWSMAISFEGSF